MSDKPFANAAQQNQTDILHVLQQAFASRTRVLEIGSGTGQHAVHFARHLPHLSWQASDCQSMLAGIQLWIDDAALSNLPTAIELDVNHTWPAQQFDAAFAANIAHIMHLSDLQALFEGLSQVLTEGAIFCLYGPFNINGHYTSDSNQRFDYWLKQRDPESGIRDKTTLDEIATNNGLLPAQSWEMAANNLLLSWKS